ncbi:nuclear transport factor 2 family protein [Actinacidiphila oryziradicis]|nr:nuclear transport factor 2 family protein [Actinacidiphila oryziradicis]
MRISMALNIEDRTVISELISMHGHLCDEGELDRLDELFTDDVVYDVTDFGQEPLTGVEAIRAAAITLGDANPVGHHVTNIVVTEGDDGQVHARSKGIGINMDGTSGSVTYEDTFVLTGQGWRISYRKIVARRVPLGGRTK